MTWKTIGLAMAFTLAGCGGGQADKAADQLDNAAQQSDPASAAVLENEADAIREEGNDATAANAAQDALSNAGRQP